MHKKTIQFPELESIRGLAALLIVIGHLPKWNNFLNSTVFNNSWLMVDLFFVLSGFVIFNAYGETISSKKDLSKFIFLRLGRIYPLHIIFLLFFLIIDIIKYSLHINGIGDFKIIIFKDNGLIEFLKHIFLVHAIPNQTGAYNFPSWSISVEFYTYIFFAALILLCKKNRELIFLIITLIAMLMISTNFTLGFEALLRCISGFFMGCIASIITQKYKFKINSIFPLISLSLIITFINLKNSNDYLIIIYFTTAVLIISLTQTPGGILKKILRLSILTWLGRISYSVYMSHIAIQWIIFNFLKRIFNTKTIESPEGNIFYLTNFESYFLILITLSITIIISSFLYYYIEKPLREKSRNFALFYFDK